MIKIEKVRMPDGVRYMSEYNELMSYLPVKGWYVLNKTLCGCGGTTVFLESDRDVILVSPRTNMLKSKHKQYPKTTHLFRESKSDKLETLMERLSDYISFGNSPSFSFKREPRKILVTIDSYKYVAEMLAYKGKMNKYLTVIDECQCLMSDASLKGQVEMEFLEILKRTTPNACFMSATPIPVEYLEWVDYFENIPYYQLEWDPMVTETPNMKPILMKKDESARTICNKIIEEYRQRGYFKEKLMPNGEVYYSREICIYLNDVSDIIRIIKDNCLRPEEVTILCSEYATKKRELLSMGFTIGGQCTDRKNPRNKTFTFLTSASFEGMDMYSDNAYTVAFFNAHKEWETHDISIELPQIMARQRLEINPFRRDAEVYYKTKANPKSEEELMAEVGTMMEKSKACIEKFNNGDPDLKELIVKSRRSVIPSERYKDYYLDVVDMGKAGYGLKINMMVVLARMNLWVMQNWYYKNPILLVAGAYDKLANNYNEKSDEQLAFERRFYNLRSSSEQLRLYAHYRELHPEREDYLKYNPHIPKDFHIYYDLLGRKRLMELDYRIKAIEEECIYVRSKPQIQEKCRNVFMPGEFYSNSDVKSKLTDIYIYLNIPKAPSAIDITEFMEVAPKNKVMQDGSRIKGFVILGG